jgi:hypothetical protein
MRIFYFFCHDRKVLNQYLSNVEHITVHLYQDSRQIGRVDLELNGFTNESLIQREYYKLFNGK